MLNLTSIYQRPHQALWRLAKISIFSALLSLMGGMITQGEWVSDLLLDSGFAHAQNRVLPKVPVAPRVLPRVSPAVKNVISKRQKAQKRTEALQKIGQRRKVEQRRAAQQKAMQESAPRGYV